MNSTKPSVGDLVRILEITHGNGSIVSTDLTNTVGVVSSIEKHSKHGRVEDLVHVSIAPLEFPEAHSNKHSWWFLPEQLEIVYTG